MDGETSQLKWPWCMEPGRIYDQRGSSLQHCRFEVGFWTATSLFRIEKYLLIFEM